MSHKGRPGLPSLIVPEDSPPYGNVIAPEEPRSAKIVVGDQEIEVTPDNVESLCNLGSGAFGVVELVQHKPTGIRLAVKKISTSNVQSEDKLMRDKEILVKASACPEIVKFYGAIFWENNLYLFMEILDASLKVFYVAAYQSHKNESSSCSEALAIPENVLGKISASVVKALNYLYSSLRVIHRDVKPSNILINRRGEVKMCDFGISGYLVNSIAQTYEAGCKPYMAPERLHSPGEGYNILSDVWSLGLTILEIAIGKYPYPGGTIYDHMTKIHLDPPPRLPEGKYSADCEHFIHSCLFKEKEKRPKYDKLLQFKFITDYETSDISQFVICVLDSMELDKRMSEMDVKK